MGQKQGFYNLLKNLVFIKFVLWWKLIIFAVFLNKSHILENVCSLDIGQNVPSQSDCQIFWMLIQSQIKYWGGNGKKWVWSVWSLNSKIDCISRMNRWNELIFCMPMQIQKKLKVISLILGGCGQKWARSFI